MDEFANACRGSSSFSKDGPRLELSPTSLAWEALPVRALFLPGELPLPSPVTHRFDWKWEKRCLRHGLDAKTCLNCVV